MKRKIIMPLFAVIAAIMILPSSVARADTQDFTIPVFEADYYLSRDAQRISRLQVTERIVAEFPATDQNHGILRALPKTYEGHGLSLKIQSVTDDAGRSRDYTTSTQNNNLVLKIGNADQYVHGRQTYNIAYSLANVTTQPGGRSAHFWDVNGDQWAQVFDQVVARVHLTPELATALQPADTRCFTGLTGSTASDCRIVDKKAPHDHIIEFAASRALQGGETLTYELGFAPGTFASYTMPRPERIKLVAVIIFLGLLPPLLASTFVVRRWQRFGRDPEGRGIIIPEYLPPKDLSVIASSILLRESFQPKALSAQIIDLAVRHYLKIYEIKTEKLLKDKISYEVELIRAPNDVRTEEKAVLQLLLGENAPVGTRVNLDTLAHKLHAGASTIGSDVTKQLSSAHYFRTDPSKAKYPHMFGGIAIIGLSFFWLPHSLGFTAAGLIILISSQFMPARTKLGVERRDYLLGLKLYMQMAEADRIKALQSPHGSLTEKIDTSNASLVKLYEKLLPYAILFGIEKDWAKEFAALYDTPPEWYAGSTSFNAGYFAGSMAGFGAASTASFTAPSSSGSGGSSGGGGGGGGGGGW